MGEDRARVLHAEPRTGSSIRDTTRGGSDVRYSSCTAGRRREHRYSIRFRSSFPEAELVELRRRVNATRWPERETVSDDSQGARLAMMQELAGYWGTEYDWRACEARLNALPNFITEIDGLDIHFIHVRSRHEDALPLIVTHGWPGSVIEQLKIIEPLTNPTAHGASASDAFDLVIPSLPGHGFSAKPTSHGVGSGPDRAGWVVLMGRLGYDRFVAQGGRLGRGGHADDGHSGRSGVARHPFQYAGYRAGRVSSRGSSVATRRRRISRAMSCARMSS